MYPVIRTGSVDGQDAMLSISTFEANVKVRQRSKQSFRFPNILLQKEKKEKKFNKASELKWSCSKESFKVVQCQSSWEISGGNDFFFMYRESLKPKPITCIYPCVT